ncbi:pyocin activator PrtN family protein [Pseudomonas nitroreducens]|jgi:hypothetical protein|uniref:pyocin activator PrtN family protein n=1 Tax=Pseudomonas nitroreducens TaxID=46680 RepID=UPI0026580A1A|nr:pyocin activator PrtN family protein [Pseudomonas nitroreducens]MCP1646966.1 hypothetical protein [Pseudomonas nitroreducens]MCP1685542.1 hypothetical protein [Pseudomonas nitroreducens]
MTTFEQLFKQWGTATLTLDQVHKAYFSHIQTEKHLRKLISRGDVALATHKLTASRREKPVVFLEDLAEFLNEKAA